jgi:hypothetical protein
MGFGTSLWGILGGILSAYVPLVRARLSILGALVG